jgi:uncharacterized protein YkwD
MQQHAHPSPLQVFLHLPGATTPHGSEPSKAPRLTFLAGVAVSVTAALVSTGALAAGATRAATKAIGAAGSCRGAHLRPNAHNARTVDAATLCLINRLRREHGLRPLRANRALSVVAASQAKSMVRGDYFADDRPSGRTPMSLVAVTRYRPHTARIAVGENIAWGTGVDTTPVRIVAAWLASRPHREVILDAEYRDAGVSATPMVPAVLHPRGRGATYVIELGTRLARLTPALPRSTGGQARADR